MPTVQDLGLNYSLVHRAEMLAAVPREELEAFMDAKAADGGPLVLYPHDLLQPVYQRS